MRAWHALERALLQCTEGLRSDCSLRLTVQCVPQDEMCRSRGVGSTKLKMSKADLHNEVHPCCLHQAPAAAMLLPPGAAQAAHGPLLLSGLAACTPIHGFVRRAGLMCHREALLGPQVNSGFRQRR